jgi:hypothetical protein
MLFVEPRVEFIGLQLQLPWERFCALGIKTDLKHHTLKTTALHHATVSTLLLPLEAQVMVH